MNNIKKHIIDIFDDYDNKNEFYFNKWNYLLEAKILQIVSNILLVYFFIRVFLLALLIDNKINVIDIPTLKLNDTANGIKFFIFFTFLVFIIAIYTYIAPTMLKDVIINKKNYLKKIFLMFILISLICILIIVVVLWII